MVEKVKRTKIVRRLFPALVERRPSWRSVPIWKPALVWQLAHLPPHPIRRDMFHHHGHHWSGLHHGCKEAVKRRKNAAGQVAILCIRNDINRRLFSLLYIYRPAILARRRLVCPVSTLAGSISKRPWWVSELMAMIDSRSVSLSSRCPTPASSAPRSLVASLSRRLRDPLRAVVSEIIRLWLSFLSFFLSFSSREAGDRRTVGIVQGDDLETCKNSPDRRTERRKNGSGSFFNVAVGTIGGPFKKPMSLRIGNAAETSVSVGLN